MRILCAGLVVCDILVKPVSTATLSMDTSRAETIKLLGGGDAFNVASNLALLDTAVSLLSFVGNDDLGVYLKDKTQSFGVDTKNLKQIDTPTSASAVLIANSGARSFVSFKGACHSLSEQDLPKEILSEFDLLYLGSAFDLPQLDGEGMTKVFKRAKECGLTTVLDTTAEPSAKDCFQFANTLKYTDIFMPSEREARLLTDCEDMRKAADIFHQMGAKVVIIKLGSKGCLLSQSEKKREFSAYNAKVVDTTGAGDAFVSGFIASYARAMKIDDCVKIALAAGAVCVGKMGASGTLSCFDELIEIALN